MGERRGVYRALVGKPEGGTIEDTGVSRRIILNLICKRMRAWTVLIWLRVQTGGGAFVNTVMNLRVP